ncbi:DivIVA domain-containing protein [Arthrobacter sp. CDRTa11]|uniref:DivIVA domain-containing protein n=1 Tax=Arthrobacter sp. CDRTa11 TaxID=2651199 RepID=UPI0023771BB8|nr:DivIVA domain-containing protein [Arthrobacter sp. CDRTa11]UZX03980.1 DivIVA domain-containing protein [Arthrobacter sp. CDRTa11]
MSYFLVFLAIVLIGVAAWAGAGGKAGTLFSRTRTGTGGSTGLPDEGHSDRGLLDGGFEQPVANLPPVLLPAEANPADVDRVRFSLGLRGYRMDQVDQVLDELRDQLAAKEAELERLRTRLLEAEQSQRASAGAADEAEAVALEAHGDRPPTMSRPEREKAEGTL